MLTHNRQRAAFTLIELLVVMTIIVVLVALTATAAFGIRNNMQKQNSEATLEKLDTKVKQRVQAIRDQIQADIPKHQADNEFNAAMSLTGNNSDGAKAIMLYARLKQQLPMSVTEAQTAFAVGGFTYQPSPAFKGLTNPGGATLEQSAACLYAAVAAMGPLDGLEQQVGTSPNGFKVFIDGFGQPIAFIRIAYDGTASELNNSPFTKNAAQDPFDPDGKAVAALTSLAATPTFICGPQLTDAGVYTTGYRAAGNRNHAIAIFSAGKNRQYIETPSGGIFDGDNLFSYRLRREGRGGE